MSHLDRDVSLPDFAQAAGRALAHGSFVTPAAGETCVLLCDSNAWTTYVASAQRLLEAGERARAARFRFEQDRVTYVLAHALWRTALGICLGMEADHVPMDSTPAGQPRLRGTGYATSLSHSGSWVAIAICADVTVGIDIERSPARIALDGLMPFMCTPAEMADLARRSMQAREAELLRLWTRKEALLKAFGVGLNEDPTLMSAMSSGLVMPPSSVPDQAPCRVLDVVSLPDGLVGALAAPATIVTSRLHRLDKAPDPAGN